MGRPAAMRRQTGRGQVFDDQRRATSLAICRAVLTHCLCLAFPASDSRRAGSGIGDQESAPDKIRFWRAKVPYCSLEKVSPGFEHVDSSSGAIGTAVNRTLQYLRYGRNLPLKVTLTRSPLGSGTRSTLNSKSIALMIPSPNSSSISALSVVPKTCVIS